MTAIECWAPECSVSIPIPPRGRHPKYCSGACRQRAVRRNGGKAPSEPYTTGLHQNAPAATVVAGPETGSRRGTTPEGRRGPDADVRGGDTATVARNVTPPPLAGGGKAGSPDHVDGPPEHGPQSSAQHRGPGPSTAAPSAPPAATFSDVPSPVGESVAGGGYSVATGDSPPAPDAPPASPEQAAPTLSIVPPPSAPDPPPPTEFYLSVVAELEAIGQHESRKGRQALAIAARMESPNTSAASVGSLSKELDRFLDEMKATAPKTDDAGAIIGDRVRNKLLQASRIGAAS